MRRPTPPVLPPNLHPGDVPVARRECRDFLDGLYHLAAPEAFWVNPLATRARSELKTVQLREAMRAGLTVPPTLMSNDPARIRRFVDEFQGRAVYKPFYPAQWEGGDGVAVLLTSEVSLDDLPEDGMLRVTPGIFQARIDKAHELRVTVMGGHFVTARLLSQELEATRLDWRAAGPRLRVEPDRLPRDVEDACRRLMANLGILFGCFDFIVTPEGEHVFLEVNPAGQFLWVEDASPDLRLLAPFVDFLLSRDPAFRWQPEADPIRHADYSRRALDRITALGPVHVPVADKYISSDLPEEASGQRRP
jgi:glutathione synthase/RimK-type ligase-like ATP-grasp enzyme